MYRDNVARTMGQWTMGQWTMNKGQGTRNKEQWEKDNKTKESNLKRTMKGLEIWYVTDSSTQNLH